MQHWERVLGDNHYTTGNQTICRFTDRGTLTADQTLWNTIHSHHRARNEHVNARFSRFNVIGHQWRGTVERLHTVAHFVANVVSADCHFNIRYEPCGPWLHRPDPVLQPIEFQIFQQNNS